MPNLYQDDGRRPFASINFVTAHDGFTLTDLVSYHEKHNEAFGEDNRSWNCGVEGPTDDEEVLALRARQRRNLLATMLLSQGVPMLLPGDELGRTQQGNNNAYCQDTELSWMDWGLAKENADLVEFTAFRKAHPVFRRRRCTQGKPVRKGEELGDLGLVRDDRQRVPRREPGRRRSAPRRRRWRGAVRVGRGNRGACSVRPQCGDEDG